MSTESGEIVVGVDGSEEATAALRWAAEEARLRGRGIVAVHARIYPALTGASTPGREVYADALRRDAEELVEAAIVDAEVPADVPVRPLLVEGDAAEALIDASEDAELLVVGSRGLGGVAGVLLGSVSRQCARRAACPVVIVRRGKVVHDSRPRSPETRGPAGEDA
jgi:nucleotide-binding universal stress UspA family protein